MLKHYRLFGCARLIFSFLPRSAAYPARPARRLWPAIAFAFFNCVTPNHVSAQTGGNSALSGQADATSDNLQLIRACDTAAGNPADRARPADIAGVTSEKLDPKIALPACEAALAAAPANPRLLYQMGRILFTLKADDKALPYYLKAAGLGYARAEVQVAWYYAHGKREAEAVQIL